MSKNNANGVYIYITQNIQTHVASGIVILFQKLKILNLPKYSY